MTRKQVRPSRVSVPRLALMNTQVEAVDDRRRVLVKPSDRPAHAHAGDRGLLHPESTASGTSPQIAELSSKQCLAYGSCNRTCEMGITLARRHGCRHLPELLEEPTRTLSTGSSSLATVDEQEQTPVAD